MARIVAPVPAHVIPNGVDTQLFQPLPASRARADLGWCDDRRYLLFPGNPDNPRKGYELAERVVAAAQARTAERLELVSLWHVPPQQVPLYMNACDAMLMTSWSEGSPNVVKEAMSCDLPVVSVAVGDTAELLTGVEGYAICPREPEVLASALLALLAANRRSVGRQALEQKQLDVDSVACRIINVYRDVLARGLTNPTAATE
jgi:glycosyltransferase involved in cell wall biosynthesis